MKKHLLSALILIPISSQAANPEATCEQALQAGDYEAAAKTAEKQNSFDGAMCAGRAQQAIDKNTAAALTFANAEKWADNKYKRMLAISFLARSTNAAGKPEQALAHYQRSLKLANEINMQQGQWVNLNEMGQIHQQQNNPQTALELFKKAAPYASNDNERSQSNQLIASASHQTGNNEQAFEYQLKSVVLEERSGDADHYINAKLQLAEYAMFLEDYTRAYRELENIIKVSKEGGSLYWEARGTLYMSRLENLQGKQKQSRDLFKKASELAQQSGIQVLIDEIEQARQK